MLASCMDRLCVLTDPVLCQSMILLCWCKSPRIKICRPPLQWVVTCRFRNWYSLFQRG
jgi:hypothetical protein